MALFSNFEHKIMTDYYPIEKADLKKHKCREAQYQFLLVLYHYNSMHTITSCCTALCTGTIPLWVLYLFNVCLYKLLHALVLQYVGHVG